MKPFPGRDGIVEWLWEKHIPEIPKEKVAGYLETNSFNRFLIGVADLPGVLQRST